MLRLVEGAAPEGAGPTHMHGRLNIEKDYLGCEGHL